MSRQLRRQARSSVPHELHFDGRGALFAYEVRAGLIDGPAFVRSWTPAQTLAAEVRNGVRWPSCGPDRLIAALRRPNAAWGRPLALMVAAKLVAPVEGSQLLTTTRKGHEVLFYLTRVYL